MLEDNTVDFISFIFSSSQIKRSKKELSSEPMFKEQYNAIVWECSSAPWEWDTSPCCPAGHPESRPLPKETWSIVPRDDRTLEEPSTVH